MPRFALLLCVTLCAVLTGTATADEPKLTLNDLLKAYTDHGLPLPPKAAKLVKYDTGWSAVDENLDRLPNYFSLAFEIAPASKDQGAVLLIGTYTTKPGQFPCEPIKPEPDSIKNLRSSNANDLVCAIQCQSRGWDKLAAVLFEQSQKELEGIPLKQLRKIAWSHWKSQITQPKIDRTPVVQRLKRLLADDKEFDTKPNRALVHSLELAVAPSTAKPGSIEALIDVLVDDTANTGAMTFRAHESEAYERIAALGFDAVPALIDHLDDDRLTRGEMTGFNNFRSWNLRVKDRVGDLIEGLAVEELERGTEKEDVGGGWLRKQQGWPIKKAAAEKWWAAAQKIGEEAYLLSKVLPPKFNDDRVGSINDHALLVIRNKYPKQLVILFQTVLETRPELEIWPLAECISAAKMTDDEKRTLFRRAAAHRNLRIRYVGLRHIISLDKKTFTTVLLDTLEQLPKDVDTSYWTCREAAFAHLAVETDDPRVWPMLEKAIARSSLGLKMELLKGIADATDKRSRTQRLRLMAQHLDDETVRDEKADKRFSGPGAGFPYRKIEVRNFVTTEMASFFDINIESDNKRTPDEWAKLREQVCAKLKQELGDMK